MSERCIQVHGKGSGSFLFGEQVCFVDISIMYLVRGLKHSFPKCMNKISVMMPRLMGLHDAVVKLDAIAAYLKSERTIPFSEGIFRYYVELDL